ncbi:MAG: hypothetical protein ACRD0K_26865, partial [Egibacteraceae bacterium]
EKEESEAAAYLSVPVNVPAMPAPALRSYAMREFGVNLEGVSEAAARQRVVQLVQGREFEVGGTKLEYDETPSARPKANPEAEERAKKRGRKNAPLVVPADPRDGAGQAQNDGPQAAPNPPVGGADANALGEPVGAA